MTLAHQIVLIASIMLLICISLNSCKKDMINCVNEAEFCARIDNQEFDATAPIIDDFLARLNKHEPDNNLEQLADWLECMSCVKKVNILCNSCIKTLPPQSELNIDFVSGGIIIPKTMDIYMDKPLRFNSYH